MKKIDVKQYDDIKVLTIVASNDGVLDWEAYNHSCDSCNSISNWWSVIFYVSKAIIYEKRQEIISYLFLLNELLIEGLRYYIEPEVFIDEHVHTALEFPTRFQKFLDFLFEFLCSSIHLLTTCCDNFVLHVFSSF